MLIGLLIVIPIFFIVNNISKNLESLKSACINGFEMLIDTYRKCVATFSEHCYLFAVMYEKLIQNHKGGIITDRKSLKKREKDFCREYVYCGNPKDAALRAGYTVFPEMCGIRLLTEKRIKDEIAELEGKLAATRAEALCGYRRIAFGNISDAVKLILESDGDRLDAEKLDLFNVAEIKNRAAEEWKSSF